jgi:hypothetical protein
MYLNRYPELLFTSKLTNSDYSYILQEIFLRIKNITNHFLRYRVKHNQENYSTAFFYLKKKQPQTMNVFTMSKNNLFMSTELYVKIMCWYHTYP